MVKVTQNEVFTAQKMKFSVKDFFSKYDQIRIFLPIWSRLQKKSLMGNFIFLRSDQSPLTMSSITFFVS